MGAGSKRHCQLVCLQCLLEGFPLQSLLCLFFAVHGERGAFVQLAVPQGPEEWDLRERLAWNR